MQNIYYVYAYLRSDGTPYYIGKGKDQRAFLKSRKNYPKSGFISILEANLTELGAFALERRYIRWYGRKDLGTGILRNFTDGGDGVSGRILTKEQKNKISENNRKRLVSEETRKRISEGNRGKKRKSLTPEHKNSISNGNRGKIVSLETRKRMSEAHRKINFIP